MITQPIPNQDRLEQNPTKVLLALQRIFTEVVGPMQTYELHHHLFDDLHLDSAGILALVQHIEDTFHITLPLSEDLSLETVQDLVDFILLQNDGKDLSL